MEDQSDAYGMQDLAVGGPMCFMVRKIVCQCTTDCLVVDGKSRAKFQSFGGFVSCTIAAPESDGAVLKLKKVFV